MRAARIHALLLGAATLYVAVLFLDWERGGVDVAGAVHMQGGSMGWTGWGLAGGLCALAIAGLELARRRGRATHPAAAFLLALGMVGATVAAIEHANVAMHMGAVTVGVDAARWPAWVGMGLAVLAALAAAAALQADEEITTHTAAGAGGATR